MVFQRSQKCGFKIVNNHFFTHFHAVEFDRKSKTTIRYEQESVEEEIADILTIGK